MVDYLSYLDQQNLLKDNNTSYASIASSMLDQDTGEMMDSLSEGISTAKSTYQNAKGTIDSLRQDKIGLVSGAADAGYSTGALLLEKAAGNPVAGAAAKAAAQYFPKTMQAAQDAAASAKSSAQGAYNSLTGAGETEEDAAFYNAQAADAPEVSGGAGDMAFPAVNETYFASSAPAVETSATAPVTGTTGTEAAQTANAGNVGNAAESQASTDVGGASATEGAASIEMESGTQLPGAGDAGAAINESYFAAPEAGEAAAGAGDAAIAGETAAEGTSFLIGDALMTNPLTAAAGLLLVGGTISVQEGITAHQKKKAKREKHRAEKRQDRQIVAAQSQQRQAVGQQQQVQTALAANHHASISGGVQQKNQGSDTSVF